MVLNVVVSGVIVVLLLAEVVLPILLILFLGFIIWRVIRRKWIHRVFANLVYKRNPLAREFYERVGHSVEEKGNRFVRPIAYIALFLCIAVILKTLWPFVIYESGGANSSLMEELPWMFLCIGLTFLAFGVSAAVISSLFFIKETKKSRVSDRSLEIYLLSKYFENIVSIILGIGLIVGVIFVWFFLLENLSPMFRYFENESASFADIKVNYEQMLKIFKDLLITFRNQFQTWCITSFLISLGSFTVPYLWFKGRRFTTVFLALFLSGTTFSYVVSYLIEKVVASEQTLIFVAVWTFSALVTYMVFHLINTISLNRISICKHCQTENGSHSKHCSECGKRLIPLPGK